MKLHQKEKEVEVAGLAAVRDLLRCLPGVEIAPIDQIGQVGHHHQVDGLIRVDYSGVTRLLAVEVKSHGAPRFVRSAVYRLESCVARMRQWIEEYGAKQLIPMLVSPYLSPESRAICCDHDVAYLDLEGNTRLVFDGVYLERSVPYKPKSETRRPIQKSGFLGWRSDRSRRRSASARRQGGLNRLVGGLSGLPGRTRGVSSDRGRGGSPDAAHRVGLSAGTPSLSRTAGSGRRPGPPAAGRRSAGWREADARSGPRGARWRWPRWSGRPDCAADCRRAPGSGPRRR